MLRCLNSQFNQWNTRITPTWASLVTILYVKVKYSVVQDKYFTHLPAYPIVEEFVRTRYHLKVYQNPHLHLFTSSLLIFENFCFRRTSHTISLRRLPSSHPHIRSATNQSAVLSHAWDYNTSVGPTEQLCGHTLLEYTGAYWSLSSSIQYNQSN